MGLRHPRATLGGVAVVLALLGVLGVGVEGELQPTSVAVPGTPSSAASQLQDEHFGPSAPFAILLRGPEIALDIQGPALVAALAEGEGVTTISPWDQPSIERLRPRPGRALVLVDFHVGADQAVDEFVPELEGILEREIRPPVSAVQTGFATLSGAIQDESVRSTRIAELIAAPIVLLVLLLVFRSPVAALIPLLFGGATVIATRGLLSLGSSTLEIDGFVLTVASMMGLALGVDYALLMVSRFREELAEGRAPLEAALRTRRAAGYTTAFAGSTLILAMTTILLLMPGSLFLSLAGTAILVTLISVLIAVVAAPPLLYLLGPNVDRWRIPVGGGSARLTMALASVLRRPRVAAVAIAAVLVVLALPVLALKTGPPSPSQLPASNSAREDAETIDRAIGPGWSTPFFLIAATDTGPVTTNARLAALERAQRRIATTTGVREVIGPAQIKRRVAPLKRGGRELISGGGDVSPGRLTYLGGRLELATVGVGRLRGGISEASAGAGLLATGSGRAGEGAAAISNGLARAASGAGGAVRALDRIDKGSARLADGQRRATLGARAVRDELSGLMPLLRQGGLARARSLRAELEAAAASDPGLTATVRQSELLVEALTLARNQAKRARTLASRLHSAQAQLADGGARLHSGAARLADAAEPLPAALDRLRSGAEQLAGGLDRLSGGADALSADLAYGADASRPLQQGLGRAGDRVNESGRRLQRRVGALRRSSPGIFESPSFVLSALEGAPPEERDRAGQVVDLEHGSQAAQMMVVPRSSLDTPASRTLYERLRDEARGLAKASGLQTGVGGGPAQLADYSSAISSRVPLVIAAVALVTFLVLLLVLRAIPLAAIAVLLNLLTVAVAFGVLVLLFEVPEGWPLGGHSYVDSIGAAGIFGIVFGLSIDYAVFLLARVRESRDSGASNSESVAFGLQRSARVITGAATIMLAVFIAFAGAPIATVSQLGTGLAVAVALDATVVRIVLLPALMLTIGDRVWWLPRWLDRVLPRFGMHSA